VNTFVYSRRRLFGMLGSAGAAAGLVTLAGPTALAAPGGKTPEATPDWAAVAQDVRAEFRWAWRNYAARALGYDQILPVSGGHSDFFASGHSVGLSLIEALDTLWVMGLDGELSQAIDWIRKNLPDFDIDAPFQVFEATIRVVGGLAAGYHVTGEPLLLRLAVDLADRLLVAFTKSPTGLPYRFVNLRTGAVSDPSTNLAEIGTYLPEFGMLSRWTGDPKYHDAAKRALRAAWDRRSPLDLLPYGIHAETGQWTTGTATIGPPADSFYEYLWGGYKLFGDTELLGWYRAATAATLKHQSDTRHGNLWFAQVDANTGKTVDTGQSELAAFYAGLLSNSGYAGPAAAYQASWSAVQDDYGVLPEGIDYTNLKTTSKGNALRPEFVDSALKLWINTRDERYRRQAYTHYRAMKRTSRAAYGYTVLDDVTSNPPVQGDFCPGYWWAEQTKYYWLIFSDTNRFDYANHFLSTEGKILLGARR
jgi:mannosyl-oligosaccharide alpha-1,2-mannosidase